MKSNLNKSFEQSNEEEIIKQIEDDEVPKMNVKPSSSDFIVQEIKHDIKDTITPNLNLNSNSKNDQVLFPRPFTLTKSRSFSIFHEKEEESDSNIFLNSDDDTNSTSIYVTHFDPQGQSMSNASIRGMLTFDEDDLVFSSEDENLDFKIPLIGHINSALMPHPSNFKSSGSRTLRLLSLTYLPDINNNSKVFSSYFAADQKILRPFLLNLISKAQNIQNERDFKPPNLKIINAPEFLNNVKYDFPKNSTVMKAEQKYLYKKPSLPPLPKCNLIPKINVNGGESSIVQEEDILNIRKALPYRHQNAEWNLLYKLSDDGCSYITFYKRIEEEEPLILLITTSSGERIGAYLPSPLQQSTHYYGSTESFVFQIDPTFSTYKWSKSNQYFVSSSSDEFSIGGGGNSAIWIDGYFNKAFSEDCSTFNSPQLTKNSHFTISEVEVWKVGHLKKKHKTSHNISNRY